MTRQQRLRPLQPVFGRRKRLGGIQVGNTPPTPSIYPFCDFFDRADGPVGPPWQSAGIDPLEIVSNQVVLASASLLETAGGQLPPVSDIEITLGMVISDNDAINTVNLARANNLTGDVIAAQITGSGVVSLQEFSGTTGLIQSDSDTWSWDNNSHDLALEIVGNAATFFLDATPVCSLSGLVVSSTGNILVQLSATTGDTVIIDNFCAVPPP